MTENKEYHEYQLPGELTSVPMTLRQLAEWNRSINIIFAYVREMPKDELYKHLHTILGLACDFLCNTCYEHNVDPFILDYWDGHSENVIVTPFKPEIPE